MFEQTISIISEARLLYEHKREKELLAFYKHLKPDLLRGVNAALIAALRIHDAGDIDDNYILEDLETTMRTFLRIGKLRS